MYVYKYIIYICINNKKINQFCINFDSKVNKILIEKYNLIVTLCNSKQLGWLLGNKFNKPVDVFVKYDSGMGRLGFQGEEFINAINLLEENEKVDIINDYDDMYNNWIDQGMDTDEVEAKLGEPRKIIGALVEGYKRVKKPEPKGQKIIAVSPFIALVIFFFMSLTPGKTRPLTWLFAGSEPNTSYLSNNTIFMAKLCEE